MCANKLELIANLEQVAANCTQTRRPMVKMLEIGQIPQPIPKHVVIKRTHSETGHHIILPDVKEQIKRDMLKEKVDINEARWFTQSFVPFLKDAGEIRMFFVGMKNIYNVHTVKDTTQVKSDWVFRSEE